MSYEYFDTLEDVARSRYMTKLQAVKLNECPYRLPADTWKDDPTKWPELDYPDVYDYLINTPGVFTRETMKSRKALEAHNQFKSGNYIQYITANPLTYICPLATSAAAGHVVVIFIYFYLFLC